MADEQKPAPKKGAIQYNIVDEIAEIEREIGMRHGVYAKHVAAGKMTQEDADYKIGVMVSACNRLKAFKYLVNNALIPF